MYALTSGSSHRQGQGDEIPKRKVLFFLDTVECYNYAQAGEGTPQKSEPVPQPCVEESAPEDSEGDDTFLMNLQTKSDARRSRQCATPNVCRMLMNVTPELSRSRLWQRRQRQC